MRVSASGVPAMGMEKQVLAVWQGVLARYCTKKRCLEFGKDFGKEVYNKELGIVLGMGLAGPGAGQGVELRQTPKPQRLFGVCHWFGVDACRSCPLQIPSTAARSENAAVPRFSRNSQTSCCHPAGLLSQLATTRWGAPHNLGEICPYPNSVKMAFKAQGNNYGDTHVHGGDGDVHLGDHIEEHHHDHRHQHQHLHQHQHHSEFSSVCVFRESLSRQLIQTSLDGSALADPSSRTPEGTLHSAPGAFH